MQEDSPLESSQLKTSFLWNSLHWSPLHVRAKSLLPSLTLQPHGLELTELLCTWDSSGKNTEGAFSRPPTGSFQLKD